MTVNYRMPDGRDWDQMFQTGNSGVSTGFLTAAGTDCGARFAGGNSGFVTKCLRSTGQEIGATFLNLGGGSPLTPGAVPAFVSAFAGVCPVTATISFLNNGVVSGTDTGTWATAGVTGANYELLWSLVSGVVPSVTPGAQNTPFALSATRQFQNTTSVAGNRTSTIAVTIRRISNPSGENFTVNVELESECGT